MNARRRLASGADAMLGRLFVQQAAAQFCWVTPPQERANFSSGANSCWSPARTAAM